MIPFVLLAVISVFYDLYIFPVGWCHLPEEYAIFWISIHAVEATALVIAVFALRNVWDTFSIREELVISCVVGSA